MEEVQNEVLEQSSESKPEEHLHHDHETEHHHAHDHETEHHHHHDHESDHHHHHENAPVTGTRGKYTLDAYTHEEAQVVSAQCEIMTSDTQADRERIQSILKDLARWTDDHNGFIGHIKASVSYGPVEMYSITDKELHCIESHEQCMRVNMACIVFSVNLQEMNAHAAELLSEFCGRASDSQELG